MKKKNSYLVAGVPGSHSGSAKVSNLNIGDCFRRAAGSTNSSISYHSFDSTVVEVKKEDITKFMEYLCSGIIQIQSYEYDMD